MNQSNEFHPDIPHREEAIIQRIAEETGCTRDEVINALTKKFFKTIAQAADETELTGRGRRKLKKALIDARLRN
jgi:hypothetical protein